MYEEQKEYERAIFNKAVEYVKNEMTNEVKDRIYKIAIGQVGWEIKKETLSPNEYSKLRDRFIAATFARVGLAEEVQGFDKDWENKIAKRYYKIETSDHFSKNAITAMENNFKEQTAAILAETGETKLNPANMTYVGNNTYVYMGKFILSFENSPADVEVRQLVEY